MTPKEKAEELTTKAAVYTDINNNKGWVDHDLWNNRNKMIAFVVADEILTLLAIQIGFYDEAAVKYWTEVKAEINAL